MPKKRRGNYIFLSWIGDHSPRHVHVYKDKRLVLKCDLENWSPMDGIPTRQILQHIKDLVEEGEL